MTSLCANLYRPVREDVDRPIEAWVRRERARWQPAPGLWVPRPRAVAHLALAVAVEFTRWFVVGIGSWGARVVCEVTSALLDMIALVVGLVLAVPVVGGIIRTILNWATEILWRTVGLADLALWFVGVRPQKKMYVGLLIPRHDDRPETTEAAMMPQIRQASDIFRRQCNVHLVYVGAWTVGVDAPVSVARPRCDLRGLFGTWWLGGSFVEMASASYGFADGWRRISGYGAQLMIVPANSDADSDSGVYAVGCSYAATQNVVVVEPSASPLAAAHELGHALWLGHSGDPANLMSAHLPVSPGRSAAPALTARQIALVRWSKHCVYV